MKFRRVIFVLLLFALFCSVLTVASFAVESEDVTSAETETAEPAEETDLIDDPAYVESKGSIFGLVYTFWYWIFGDAFDTSEKICTLLSVITIVWAIYLLIPKRKAV